MCTHSLISKPGTTFGPGEITGSYYELDHVDGQHHQYVQGILPSIPKTELGHFRPATQSSLRTKASIVTVERPFTLLFS